MATHAEHLFSYRSPVSGRSFLALIVKRTYSVQPARGRLELADEVPPIDLGPTETLSGSLPRMRLDGDAIAPLKTATDVLLVGRAHAGRPAESVETSLEVGPVRKAVRVHGDRRITVQQGAIAFTAAKPFESMEIVWERAYGGRDEAAEKRLGIVPSPGFGIGRRSGAAGLRRVLVYPRNFFGCGYFVGDGSARLEGQAVPNLEDPADPVSADRLLSRDEDDWVDRPIAAAYEPIDPLTMPRSMFLLRPDYSPPSRPFFEVGGGVLESRDLDDRDLRVVDPRVYNCAPTGLARARLCGDELVRARGLHRDRELLELSLPGEVPSLTMRPPGCGAYEVEPLLQTVLFELEEDRVTLTWTGNLEVQAVYPDSMIPDVSCSVVWRAR